MRRTSTRTTAVAVVAVAALLAGCAGRRDAEDVSLPPPSTSTPAPASSTTSEAASSSTTVSSSTSAAGPACPGTDTVPPGGASDVSEVEADVDGDGAGDRVLAYRRADGVRRVAVELAAGGTAAVDASSSDIDGPSPLSVLGGVDLGGDGQTVLAVTGAGASVVVVGLFQFVECAITRVVFASGGDVELPVSGGITHGDGIRCSPGDAEGPLVRLRATSTDGETYAGTETRYRIDGNTLVEVGSRDTTLNRGSDDAAIDAYYDLDCPGLQRGLPG